jgi:hypothetical protein
LVSKACREMSKWLCLRHITMRLLPELHPSASAILDERKADRIGGGDVPEGQPRRACSAKYGRGNRRGSCCQRGDGCSLVAQYFNEAAAASGQEMVRTNSAHPDSQLRHFSITVMLA